MPDSVLFAAFAVVLAGCAGTDRNDGSGGCHDRLYAGSVQPRVLLPFVNGVSFCPVRLADQLGYFKEEGIGVDVQNRGESSDVVKGVVAGNGDVGLSLTSPIILGAAQD